MQTSENLFAHGIIDGVVAPEDVPDLLGRALDILMAPRTGNAPVPAPRPDRPGVRRLLRNAASIRLRIAGVFSAHRRRRIGVGGTPRDPRDDEEIDWVDLRQLGYVADYCAATVAAVSDLGQASRSRGYRSWRTVASGPEHRRIAVGGRP